MTLNRENSSRRTRSNAKLRTLAAYQTGTRRNLLTREHRERVTGIEPALSAWEADVLPLNYTRRTTSDFRPLGRGLPRARSRHATGQVVLLACCSLIVTSRPRSSLGG
jgi:hypothetical protein